MTLFFETTNCLNTVDIRPDKNFKIILALGANKAHGYDDISVRMIVIGGFLRIKPLRLLFNNFVKQAVSPNIWRMANALPVHKKNKINKQLDSNYRPISSLPIC